MRRPSTILSLLLLALSLQHCSAFVGPQSTTLGCHGLVSLSSTRTDTGPTTAGTTSGGAVDPNEFNVSLEQAAALWTVSVSETTFLERQAGIPFMDSKSKDHYVDTIELSVSRQGGMGLELLELAGGREQDDLGIVIVEGVNGNAQQAGVIPGDSIAAITIVTNNGDADESSASLSSSESVENLACECRNFDTTMGLLTSLPAEAESVVLTIKRLRRWPKVQVVVEYPPIQCANPKENTEEVELFAGENLRQALLNRGIVFEDSKLTRKCDFCGGKCTIKVDLGMELLNPMSLTEEKLMKNNPKCRLGCKTIVAQDMQEGVLRLKVNLGEWTDKDKRDANVFFSR
ncbi:Ferredoxin [Seminavis robusta]|uniref:Ferredoxin n=1 Tax=Seminavis robusta TaxID=568900 RepID=A0A9N8HKM3_9STRA|nr:Ferredoxin [Seminavis robusta]|eukprot:Sro954_g224380.1 Ferredoxin (345) ;mRNA; r:36106-37140